MARHRPSEDSVHALLPVVARSMIDGMVITDGQGRTTWINDSFTQLCGYTIDELRGIKPGIVLQGSGTDVDTINYIRSAIRVRQPCKAEILNYHKDGHPYWTSLHVTPIQHQGEQGFVALAYDITARKPVDLTPDRITHDLKHGFLPRCA